ncbi:hypothetical protein [Paracoccus sp. T5]|uniref:hypothetical protein n=1 Tax=Paracoccus sp. T5 TaxID=3402161 RepID=UPI003AE0F42C
MWLSFNTTTRSPMASPSGRSDYTAKIDTLFLMLQREALRLPTTEQIRICAAVLVIPD